MFLLIHYSTCTGTPVEMTMNWITLMIEECICSLMVKIKNGCNFVSGGARAGLNIILNFIKGGDSINHPFFILFSRYS
jgi:hypothetical protein